VHSTETVLSVCCCKRCRWKACVHNFSSVGSCKGKGKGKVCHTISSVGGVLISLSWDPSGGNTQTRACSKRAAVNIVSFIRTAAPAMRSRATSAVATCRNDPNDNVTKVCCLVEQALTAATIADCIDRLRGDGVGGRDPEHSDRKRDDSIARRLQVIVAERLRPRQDIVSRFVFLCLRWMTPEQAF